MDLGISTQCFGTTPLTAGLLERLRRTEFSAIELHAALPGFDYQNRSAMRDTLRWFSENEMPSPSLHLPYAEDVLAPRYVERQRALDELKRCLELGDVTPLKYAVLHLGGAAQAFNPVHFEYAYAAVLTIQSFSGLRVLLETLDNDIATFSRIAEFRTASQIPNVGICYDTGHGELEGVADAIHLDDSNGALDEHLWPFQGKRNWPALIERLVVSSFEGPMILEARNDSLDLAQSARNRLRDLMDEARDSIEEFRLKYKLPLPRQEDDE